MHRFLFLNLCSSGTAELFRTVVESLRVVERDLQRSCPGCTRCPVNARTNHWPRSPHDHKRTVESRTVSARVKAASQYAEEVSGLQSIKGQCLSAYRQRPLVALTRLCRLSDATGTAYWFRSETESAKSAEICQVVGEATSVCLSSIG